MLQRLQSLFLLIAVVAMLVFLFTPVWIKVSVDTQEMAILDAFNLNYSKGIISGATPTYYLAVMAIASILISIFTIFQYRNRTRQMLLVALNSLIQGALMITIVYLTQKDFNNKFAPAKAGGFSIGLYAVFFALMANWLANRFIRRDEKMVRDSDRMR
jgi:magnesium-transporting ATPase (P-type)